MDIVISKSDRKDKKLKAVIDGKKTVHFGASGYSDYTLHKDDDRKDKYIQRHKKNENWNDIKTAGFYAKHILWNKPTIQESIKDINKKYKNINITYK
jgi:hypothetical protein